MANKKLLVPLNCRLNANRFREPVKLIRYLASAVIVPSSKSCVVPSPRTNIFLFLPSICTEELLSTPKIMTLFSSLPSDHENCERESNPIWLPLYLYLSGSALLVSFTSPNKQLPGVKSVFKSFDYVFNIYKIYKLTTFLC